MCGIAALFVYGVSATKLSVGELTQINKAMIRRGPDGAGHWVSDDNRIGLAHRRLAIIDPDVRANQPMTIDQRYWITFNGEIYNYRSLRAELQSAGVKFKTESDTEVLLRLYEWYGPDMVPKLRGMFAFIIWDNVGRRLFMARDAFGIKPLYISDNGTMIRVASTVKALRAGGYAGNTGPDPAGHVGFFLFGSVPEPHTLYSDIKALPAGHSLSIGLNGERSLVPYFDIRENLEISRHGKDTGVLRDLLMDSIRHHFISDVPVGVFLSGGLDSASITGLASEEKQGAIKTITLGFQEFFGTQYDEVPLAEIVANHYNTVQMTERISRVNFDSALEDIMANMDQPSIDGVNTYFVAKVAAKNGLKVALSGIGGDELFGGYDSFLQVPRLARLLGWIPGLPHFGRVFRAIAAPLFERMISPKYAGLFEYGGSTAGSYLLRRGLFMPWELPKIMDPDFAAAGWQSLQPIIQLENSVAGLSLAENRVRALETNFYLRNQLLRDADWAGMAHSLEIRVPFLDIELFKALAPLFGTTLSPTKRDMAETLENSLPGKILNKPKTGFSVPVEQWFSETAAGSDKIEGTRLRKWAKYVYKVQTGA